MKGLNAVASVLIGVYLVAVAYHGNASTFVDVAKRDRAFLKWLIAAGVLYWLYNIPSTQEPAKYLIVAAAIGFGLQAGTPFRDRVAELWARLDA